MKISVRKRFLAYLIDFFIISILLSTIMVITDQVDNSRVTNLQREINELSEQKLKREISLTNYVSGYSIVLNKINKEQLPIHVGNTLLILLFLVVIPIMLKGQTIGMKIFKIKIKKDKGKLTILDLIGRNIIISGLGYLLFSILLTYIIFNRYYLIYMLLLSMIQLLLVIISVFMILYREDQKGLHDLVTKTKIANI